MKAILNRFRQRAEATQDNSTTFSILFVCMGNICRSPTAEGVFRKVWQESVPDLDLLIDSAGTHEYHAGRAPDARAQRAAALRGVDLSRQRARMVEPDDFDRFDLILPMDRMNLGILRELSPTPCRAQIRLFLEFAPSLEHTDVPDPYYGGINGFEHVLDLVEEASRGLLDHVRAQVAEQTPQPS